LFCSKQWSDIQEKTRPGELRNHALFGLGPGNPQILCLQVLTKQSDNVLDIEIMKD